MRIPQVVMMASALATASVAEAAQTQYQYDALGRLKQAQQSASTDAPTSRFTYDAAGNRTQAVVENSVNGSATGVVVTPMGSGFAVIPFDRQ